MSNPFVGEIRLFAGNFAPQGWAICDGSLLPISEYDTLFNLIGTTYGGDGQSTFALPDLRGRIPMHQGSGGGQSLVLGQLGGAETVTLGTEQIPMHRHVPWATAASATSSSPTNNTWANWPDTPYAAPGAATATPMSSSAVGSSGGSQPHDNLPPFLVINFIISLFGIYPSQV